MTINQLFVELLGHKVDVLRITNPQLKRVLLARVRRLNCNMSGMEKEYWEHTDHNEFFYSDGYSDAHNDYTDHRDSSSEA